MHKMMGDGSRFLHHRLLPIENQLDCFCHLHCPKLPTFIVLIAPEMILHDILLLPSYAVAMKGFGSMAFNRQPSCSGDRVGEEASLPHGSLSRASAEGFPRL